MTIRFACPRCNKTMKAPPHLAGRSMPCPNCRHPLVVPGGTAPPVVPTAVPVPAPSFDFDPSIEEPAPVGPYRRARHQGSGTGMLVVGAIGLLLLGGGVFAALWFSGVLKRGAEAANASGATATQAKGTATEEEARQVLKTVLDSRQLGETAEQFKRNHSNVTITGSNPDFIFRDTVLLKYEIGPSAPDDEKGPAITAQYKFQVTLVFQSQAGTEIRENKLLRVGRTKDGNWIVISMLNS